MLKEVGVELTSWMINRIRDGVIDRLKSLANSIRLKGKSPIELRVIDSKGRVAGVVNKTVKHEIPMSLYYNGTVTMYFPADTYRYEVAGVDEGVYNLEITSLKSGNATTFNAFTIPTSANTVHQYTVDWDTLSAGEEGVTVMVDADGDGIFEQTFNSDSELTVKEFMFPAKAIFTFNAFWEGVYHPVMVVSSNSTITGFDFNQPQKQIRFELSGETGSIGYCNITIPKSLLKGEPWTVKLNGSTWPFTAMENETHSFIYFTFTHASIYEIIIEGTWVIPEFPTSMIMLLLMVPILFVIVFAKKRFFKNRS